MDKESSLLASRKKILSFDLDGNALSLDFVNTLEFRDTEKEIEWLVSYADALCWSERVSLLAPEAVSILFGRTGDEEDSDLCVQVRAVREIIHAVLSEAIDNELSSESVALRDFNSLCRTVVRGVRVSEGKTGLSWFFPGIEEEPLGFLQPLIQDAADLLSVREIRRLKRCSNPMCGWLYYDTSRNNSRRWCCMETCGNRAKAKRFYHSHR